MIVQFMTNPGSVVVDHTAAYLNFLRCATAIATAAAGTTSLTVNPLTSSGAINASQNCIIGIVANTEAGGWTTSTKHNVPGSLVNTAQTYTAIQTASDYLYVADFYNNSTKSSTPYKKLSFHSYNSVSKGSYNMAWFNNGGLSASYLMNKTDINGSYATNIQLTFGAASSTDWADNTYAPAQNSTYPPNTSGQVRSFTTGSNGIASNGGSATSYWNAGHALDYYQDSPNKIFTMAITADYCIIWETYYGNSATGAGTYTGGYSSAYGNGTTYWYNQNYGFITYAGLRTTQPWEDTATNNVPWVVFHASVTPYGTGATSSYSAFAHNQLAASMLTMNNLNSLTQQTPRVFSTANAYNKEWFFSGRKSNVQTWAEPSSSAGNRLDGPIYTLRQMGASNFSASGGETLSNSNNPYMPQVDPVTGVMVPGAYPITISRSHNNDWNPGGQIRGLYKSLSMPFTNMKQYWLSGNQTFTVNGEQYLPFVINEDMWLVRYA